MEPALYPIALFIVVGTIIQICTYSIISTLYINTNNILSVTWNHPPGGWFVIADMPKRSPDPVYGQSVQYFFYGYMGIRTEAWGN